MCFRDEFIEKNNEQEEIGEIAYDVNKRYGYTVYLEDVPYLVLTDDYNGNVLLLRKYILNERRMVCFIIMFAAIVTLNIYDAGGSGDYLADREKDMTEIMGQNKLT